MQLFRQPTPSAEGDTETWGAALLEATPGAGQAALLLWECPGSIIDLGDSVAVRTGKGLHPGCLSGRELSETFVSNGREMKEVMVEEGNLLGRILGNRNSQSHAESIRLFGELCVTLVMF